MAENFVAECLALETGIYSGETLDGHAVVRRARGKGFEITIRIGEKEWQTSHYNEAGELEWVDTEIE